MGRNRRMWLAWWDMGFSWDFPHSPWDQGMSLLVDTSEGRGGGGGGGGGEGRTQKWEREGTREAGGEERKGERNCIQFYVTRGHCAVS